MNPVDWIAPLKEAVLLMYFLVFSGIVVWAFHNPDTQDHAQIPFLEDAPAMTSALILHSKDAQP